MDKKEKIVAMIPARIGSTRLPMKNIALLDGKPLISYAVNAAKASNVFDRIVINSDSEIFSKIAEQYAVDFYFRPKKLASSSTKSDDVVYDFMKNNECDILSWVNSISPLQTSEEINAVVNYFKAENLDSLITVQEHQVHALYNGKPINYETKELFAQTQDLIPVQLFVYSIMMWKTKSFINEFEKNNHAFFVGKVGFFPVSKFSSIIIKRKEDLQLTEYILQSLKTTNEYKINYDNLVDNIKYGK